MSSASNCRSQGTNISPVIHPFFVFVMVILKVASFATSLGICSPNEYQEVIMEKSIVSINSLQCHKHSILPITNGFNDGLVLDKARDVPEALMQNKMDTLQSLKDLAPDLENGIV